MKVSKPIYIIATLCISISCLMAGNIFSYAGIIDIEKEEDMTIEEIVESRYQVFKECAKSERNFEDPDKLGRAYFSDVSDKLIIGCSPVVYAALNARDLFEKEGYDIVGYGGTTDAQVLEWLQGMYKKYERIIIWGAANDVGKSVGVDALLSDEYLHKLKELIEEAKNHIKDENPKKVVFVNLRPMIPGIDNDALFCDFYNLKVKQLNDYVRSFGISTVDILAEPFAENSEWYLHYTNRDIFSTLIKDVDNLFN